MEYEVIESRSSECLAQEVNAMILLGFKPQGGVSVSLSESDDYQYVVFCQAMIKGV